VSESGRAHYGGAKDVSQTFADGYWHFDQLGIALTYNLKVFCRQTLIGGNYALLNTTTSIPNPDYYGSSRNLRSTDVVKPKSEFRGYQNREEYHLVALAGNIQGQIVLLNDIPMVPTETFDIPTMEPKLVHASTPISVAAYSIVYVTIRDFQAPVCA
ncbi:hypothetical protein Goarm_022730, partial [Gossypium armourianum]|nr:hypothetical protein [Gossypium armourianum]